jgi:NADH-ubiquinone oxidoreductase chain 2
LEINLIRLIPLLIIKLSPLSTETAIKYFLVQAIASLLIIFSRFIERIFILNSIFYSSSLIIIIALGIKIGIAPFHFWFPQVIKISDWAQCTLILTWQKIAPFVLIICIYNTIIIYVLILFSAVTGSLGGLNQTSIKNILTYSSIIHSAWILAICSNSFNSWLIYFFIYSFISIRLIFIVYKSKITFIYDINLSKWNKVNKIVFFIRILSLGGLPPFLGFFSKIIAIQIILSTKISVVVILILVSGSLVSLYFYTRIIYSIALLNTQKILINLNNLKQNNIFLSSTIIVGNVVAPLIVSLI